jgi:hypothetical protein
MCCANLQRRVLGLSLDPPDLAGPDIHGDPSRSESDNGHCPLGLPHQFVPGTGAQQTVHNVRRAQVEFPVSAVQELFQQTLG